MLLLYGVKALPSHIDMFPPFLYGHIYCFQSNMHLYNMSIIFICNKILIKNNMNKCSIMWSTLRHLHFFDTRYLFACSYNWCSYSLIFIISSTQVH